MIYDVCKRDKKMQMKKAIYNFCLTIKSIEVKIIIVFAQNRENYEYKNEAEAFLLRLRTSHLITSWFIEDMLD